MKNKKLSRSKVSISTKLNQPLSFKTILLIAVVAIVGIFMVFQKSSRPNVSEVSQPIITFNDVPPTHWAYNPIFEMVSAGVMTKTDSTNFSPNAEITRADVARYLLRLKYGNAHTPPVITSAGRFSDVNSSHWAFNWIEQLASEGISSGCGANKFCPDQVVTRDQLAVMMLKTKYGNQFAPPAATGTIFADVPASHWAAKWIEVFKLTHLTSGCNSNSFCPSTPVTRAQMAVFSQHFLNMPYVAFLDVPFTDWAGNVIYKMVTHGYMTGCDSTHFCPNSPLTRADAAKYILLLKYGTSYQAPNISRSSFTDVPVDHPQARWIHNLVGDGISSGCGNNNFCPNSPITRGQIAIMILRARFGSNLVPPTATGTVFTDVSTSTFGASWIELAKAKGITSGCSATRFCPTGTVTRAQMAAYLDNTLQAN